MYLLLFLFSTLSFSSMATLGDYEKYYQATLTKVKNLKVIKKYKDGVTYSCQGQTVEGICGTMGCTNFESFIENDCDGKETCFPKTIIHGGKDHFAGEYKGKPYVIQCEQYLCQQKNTYTKCLDAKTN